MTYIHYGSDHFSPQLFIPARNGDWRPKPAVGTGLWASRVCDEFGWEFWCRENHSNLERLQTSFRFTLPYASILTLEDPALLIRLPKLHSWETKKPMWGSVYAGDGYSIFELLPYVNSQHGPRRKVAGWYGLYRAVMIDYILFA